MELIVGLFNNLCVCRPILLLRLLLVEKLMNVKWYYGETCVCVYIIYDGDWGPGRRGECPSVWIASLDRTARRGTPRIACVCFQQGDSGCHFVLGIQEGRRAVAAGWLQAWLARRIPRSASRWYRRQARLCCGPPAQQNQRRARLWLPKQILLDSFTTWHQKVSLCLPEWST